MTINQRVQKLIDELYAGNKRAFSKAVGIAPTVTENIVGTRKSNPSFDVTCKIAGSIDRINLSWFLMGEGDMFNTKEDLGLSVGNVAEGQALYVKKRMVSARPFVKVLDTIKGALTFREVVASENTDALILPVADYDFSVLATDNSMLNEENPDRSIQESDIVACKYLKDVADIRMGEVYLLSTSKGTMIRKVEHSDTKDYIRCIPFNTEGYDSFELPLSEVYECAAVAGTISVNVW